MTETITMEPIYLSSEVERKRLKSQLDATILDAVDESLATFGESVKQGVYFYLENKYHIEKQDIPSKIGEFASGIEEVFGIGAKLIEMKIMQALYTKVNGFLYVPKRDELVFKDYVETVRCFLSSTVVN